MPFNAPFYETCGFVETEPDTEFHRGLVGAEHDHGLSTSERRIQMTRALHSPGGPLLLGETVPLRAGG
ncbi:hypothetical protein [Agromyces sp. PvR057]|uniref:hypothetical protein n=1 Tax=Agromyces sp. PvR057 TaxID=3156403 RepID=UPI00339A8CC2